MSSFLFNRKLALGIALVALVSELWRGFLDAMFVLPIDFGEPGLLQLAAAIFTALFTGWGLALAFALRGSRWATIISFGLNLLILLAVPIGWLFFYCTAECRVDAGIFNLANSLNLGLGGLAAIALAGQIFKPRTLPRVYTQEGS